MFIMLTSGVDEREDTISCYDRRTHVEQAFDVLKNELDGKGEDGRFFR